MKVSKGLILAGSLLPAVMLPAVCMADYTNYNFIEGNYLQGERSEFDVDGWRFNGSFKFTERAFVSAAYEALELDESIPGLRLEGDKKQIGLGYIFGENDTASVFGSISYVRLDGLIRFDDVSVSDDEDGYELALGVRMNLGAQAELNFGVTHLEVDRSDSETVPEIGLFYKFTERFAGVANYKKKSDDDTIGLGVRFYF